MTLPILSRRALLAGAGSAVASAALASALASTVADEGRPDLGTRSAESAELIDLGSRLPAVEAEFVEATEARQQAIDRWWHKWPVAPDTIASPGCHGWRNDERMFTGAPILRDRSVYLVPQPYIHNHERPRSVITVGEFERAIDDLRRAIRRKRKNPFAPFNAFYLNRSHVATVDQHECALDELISAHADAVIYEDAKAQMLSEMRWEEVDARAKAAQDSLIQTVNRILAIPAAGLQGIVTKAMAIAAYGRIPPALRVINDLEQDWAGNLGVEIVRIGTDRLSA